MSRGLWVAIFGPDGVGKSAVIQRLQAQLGPRFTGYRRFHFRPSFGRCIQREPVTAPHNQSPRGFLLSVGKLLYWLADCCLGYLAFILPAVRVSEMVLFDRYLPDILVDPVRYRLPANVSTLSRLLVRLAPQPDLYILLDAPAESVQQRKQELSLAESRRQRDAYRELFSTLPHSVTFDADRSVQEVAANIAELICSASTAQIRDAALSSTVSFD